MSKFKVGQQWRMRNGEIDTITRVDRRRVETRNAGYYLNGNLLGGGGNHFHDLVTLIEDVPEDDLHPCLERQVKLTDLPADLQQAIIDLADETEFA